MRSVIRLTSIGELKLHSGLDMFRHVCICSGSLPDVNLAGRQPVRCSKVAQIKPFIESWWNLFLILKCSQSVNIRQVCTDRQTWFYSRAFPNLWSFWRSLSLFCFLSTFCFEIWTRRDADHPFFCSAFTRAWFVFWPPCQRIFLLQKKKPQPKNIATVPSS